MPPPQPAPKQQHNKQMPPTDANATAGDVALSPRQEADGSAKPPFVPAKSFADYDPNHQPWPDKIVAEKPDAIAPDAPSTSSGPATTPAAAAAAMGKQLRSAPPTLAPGQLPPAATVFQMPGLKQKSYFECFPEMAPIPAGPESPGVWLHRSGQPYTPRQRRGGQFAALMLIITNNYRRDVVRREVVPANTLEDDYPYNKDYEVVTERIEVICDFEDERDALLEAFGRVSRRTDPLAARMRQKGFGDYDNEQTTPGMQHAGLAGHRRAA